MSGITTHVLDTARGQPASGVPVRLEHESSPGAWSEIGAGVTDADGRLRTLNDGRTIVAGTYRITFDTARYFQSQSREGFYPHVAVTFVVRDPSQHFHVPLLLSPFGFSTYRGS
jgi:5-hydroxyisourate hydrolase